MNIKKKAFYNEGGFGGIKYYILLQIPHTFLGGAMTKLHEIYVCPVCGNRIEIVHDGAGELVCCGQPMKRAEAGTSDGAAEKHVPVIEKIAEGYRVKVGSVEHPSTEAHYIEWIELICLSCGKVQRKHLKPGDKPEAVFETKATQVFAREYCNLHGLWQSEK